MGMAKRTTTRRPRAVSMKRLYVIRLDCAVLQEKAFADANPGYRPDKPCVYVGSTGLTPEARFAQHMSGKKSGRYVEKYGVRLMQPKTRNQPEVPWTRVEIAERRLAERLRAKGYAVWQR